jgi:hypothetical protein
MTTADMSTLEATVRLHNRRACESYMSYLEREKNS